jgi:hypothetical protein
MWSMLWVKERGEDDEDGYFTIMVYGPYDFFP